MAYYTTPSVLNNKIVPEIKEINSYIACQDHDTQASTLNLHFIFSSLFFNTGHRDVSILWSTTNKMAIEDQQLIFFFSFKEIKAF